MPAIMYNFMVRFIISTLNEKREIKVLKKYLQNLKRRYKQTLSASFIGVEY